MENGASSYRRFLDGDENGIAEIIEEYKDGLILYICGYVMNIHTAEDIAEDVFFKLMIKKPHYAPRYSFRSWLYAIGRNLARDHLRRSKKQVLLSEEAELAIADEEDLRRSYIKNEERILLHKAIASLRDDYREVIYLTYFEGFSNEEAARVLKRSKHAVETLAYRARLALKVRLEKEGFSYEEF